MLGSACVFLTKDLLKFIVNLCIESSFQIEAALHIIAILSVSITGISLHLFRIFFSAIMYNFQCASLGILLNLFEIVLLMLILLKGNCFLNSFSDYYLLVYTDKTM